MIGCLLLATVLASTAAAGSDPGALIAQLAAENFDDRVAAYKALEQLGREALPALRAAADAEDPRVRSRVRALLEFLGRQAEVNRISRPTLLRLDFHDRPLGEVVDTLNERHNLGFVLQLGPAPRRGMMMIDPQTPARLNQLRGRPITLEASEPIPFWEAVDRLCDAAALRYDVSAMSEFGIGSGSFTFMADRTGRGPVSDSGPFRVQVVGVQSTYQRDFTGDPDLARQATGRPGAGVLSVSLAVIPEPGLVLHQVGPLALEEAVEDQGRSLLPGASQGPDPVPGAPWSFGGVSVRVSFRVRAGLVAPDPPATWIRRLRGNVPVAAVAQRPDPLIIPLKGDASLGKPFRNDDMTLVVEQASLAPGAQVSVTVTVRSNRKGGDLPTGNRPDPRRANYAAFRLDQVLRHLELYDAKGRKLKYTIGGQTQFAGIDRFTRYRLEVQPIFEDGAAGGPFPAPGPAPGPRASHTPIPAELRYYDFVQTATEVPFDLRDIPMP